MDAKELMSDEFFKQFKTGQELNDFLKQIQKRGIEKMLEGELDEHLGYEKNQKSAIDNSRNGYAKKKVRTSYGESEIEVPEGKTLNIGKVENGEGILIVIEKTGEFLKNVSSNIIKLASTNEIKGNFKIEDLKKVKDE